MTTLAFKPVLPFTFVDPCDGAYATMTSIPNIPPSGDTFVQSLARGLAVIRAFTPSDQQLTLAEVARKTGLARAVSRRFLMTLEQLGYVRLDGRHFQLTSKVAELAILAVPGAVAEVSDLVPDVRRRVMASAGVASRSPLFVIPTV